MLFLLYWPMQKCANWPNLMGVANLSQAVRDFRTHSRTITLKAALKVLGNDEYLFSCLANGSSGFSRSLPEKSELKGPIAQLLQGVLANNKSADTLSNESLNYCYKRGWLQAELD